MDRTLYVSDLDGTLLGPDARISPRSCGIINRLVKNGMAFTCATARSMVTAAKVSEGLEGDIPFIIYNGAFIVERASRRILDSVYMPQDTAREIIADLAENGVFPIVYAFIDGRECYSYVPGKCGAAEEAHIISRGSDPRNRETDERGLYEGDIFYISAIGDESLDRFRRRYSENKEIRCIYQNDIYSGDVWLEILSARATKANAIKKLMELEGCSRTVCFGDGVNDIPMFMAADECYAVANADPRLKEAATGVIGPNSEDSVALWLAERYNFQIF